MICYNKKKTERKMAMFTFVQTKSPDTPVSSEMLSRLEQEYGFQIPQMLREYYLAYNGSDIEECQFKVRTKLFSLECCVTQILTVGYGQYDFAYYLTSGRRTRKLPDTLIPFALDEADDAYCWDQTSGRIFYVQADEEAPILLCEDMETFFGLMETGGEVTMPAVNPVKEWPEWVSPRKKEEAERVLTFRKKPMIVTLLICLGLVLVSVMMMPFTDDLSVLVAVAIGIYTIMFLIIWTSHWSKSSAAVKKYGRENLLLELTDPETVYLKNSKAYLTKNYIICNHLRVNVAKYSDIAWVYHIGFGSAINYMVNGHPIKAHLKDGTAVVCAHPSTDWEIKQIYDWLLLKNREILLGYTRKNKEAYRKSCPKYRRQKLLEGLIVGLVILLAILVMQLR